MSIIKQAEDMGYSFYKRLSGQKKHVRCRDAFTHVKKSIRKKYGIDTYQMYGATEVGDVAMNVHKKRMAYLRGNHRGICRSDDR
jgi:phenylacetate-CoA ligase